MDYSKTWKIGKLTPSETKMLDSYTNSEIYKLLYAARSNGGYLLAYVEKVEVRKTRKHQPPFKYFRAVINKWGKVITRYSGNIWSKEHEDIIDDFSKISIHNRR